MYARLSLSSWLLLLLLMGGLVVAKEGHGQEGGPAQLKGKKAPEFILPRLDGQTYRLSDSKGKVVLLDFWHTY